LNNDKIKTSISFPLRIGNGDSTEIIEKNEKTIPILPSIEIIGGTDNFPRNF